MNEGISLYELNKRVKGCIEAGFLSACWVKAEVSAIKTNYTGHCYIDLIDKGDSESDIRAKGHAIVWSSSWRILGPYFRHATGKDLCEGMNILVKAQVQFSELYGLSLIISEIDPSFTVGEAELRRREVIQRLRKEGMFEMNTELELPVLPKRFAVVSAESAAGYRDFIRHLHENEYGFRFYTRLYPAPMQGNTAPGGIIDALERVMTDVDGGVEVFDALLIIRGGGSNTDLSCFDDYELCANVAQFPLPVMVAVGHDQDRHICDEVACVSVKTPTALADYILDIFASEQAMLESVSTRLAMALNNKFAAAHNHLQMLGNSLGLRVKGVLQREAGALDLLEQRVLKGDPARLMEVGYCVVEASGKRVVSAGQLNKDDKLMLMLKDGAVECRVEEIYKK
jgi:exodeoxyribonuclease VII large subunit